MNRVKMLGLSPDAVGNLSLHVPVRDHSLLRHRAGSHRGRLIFAFILLLSLGALLRTSSFTKLGWISLAIGTALGITLTFTGATRPMAPFLYGHIFLCALECCSS